MILARPSRTWLVAIVALLCLALAPGTAGAWNSTGDVILPGAGRATAMTLGPEGAVWFAGARDEHHVSFDPGAGIVGRITPKGKVQVFVSPHEGALRGIAVGSDGALWTLEPAGPRVVRVTTSGQFSFFALPASAEPSSIVAGPDGALWFADADSVGRITTAGALSDFPLPAGSGAEQIVAGADGELWVTAPGADAIDRVGTDGKVTAFPLGGGAKNGPVDLALGGEGGVFFTQKAAEIGRLSTGGEVTEFPISHPAGVISAGPDGNLWFSEPISTKPENFGVNGIASITPEGHPTGPVCAWECSYPVAALTQGPDGRLWFAKATAVTLGGGGALQGAEAEDGHVGRFVPPPLRLGLPARAHAHGSTARLPIECRAGTAGEICKGRVTFAARSRTGRRLRLGIATFHLFSGERATTPLHLTRSARRTIAKSGPLTATATSPVRLAGSRPVTVKIG
jgi:virginiamycin B lyase